MTKKCTILSLSRGRPGKTVFWKPVFFCQCHAKPSVGPHLI